jgi:endonuclease/exonuclease/phosphatase family metal-dependent hydrolase
MRIVAWNVAHQALSRPIKPAIPQALGRLAADVIVLTEYVERRSLLDGHDFLCAAFGEQGLSHIQLSPENPAKYGGRVDHFQANRVLIASRYPLERRADLEPEPAEYARTNYLQVWVPDFDLNLIGLRVPAYATGSAKRAYWKWFEALTTSWSGRRMVIIGDLNADPDRKGDVGGAFLARIRASGAWAMPDPAGDPWSFFSKNGSTARIDRALIAPSVGVGVTSYLAESEQHRYAGRSAEALSDHSVLICDLDVIRGTNGAMIIRGL